MSSSENKRKKMDQSDGDIIPESPLVKLKKKKRKKTVEYVDSDDLFADIDFTEELLPAKNNKENYQSNFAEILDGIDFNADFNDVNVSVSKIPSFYSKG